MTPPTAELEARFQDFSTIAYAGDAPLACALALQVIPLCLAALRARDEELERISALYCERVDKFDKVTDDLTASKSHVWQLAEELAQARTLISEMAPAVRDIFWIACCWNDHNFTDKDLRDKADRIAKTLGVERNGNGVDGANEWLARAASAQGEKSHGN